MRKLIFLALFSIAVSSCAGPEIGAVAENRAVVIVDGGSISGAPASGSTTVWTYKAIPFAAPPVGDLRWREPQPAAAWQGTRDATHFSKACFQALRAEGSFYGQIVDQMGEDCLYLNVWTAAQPTERRPVMVWIHGGGLTSGHGAEATYDGTALANRGVVLVTINYRLGPFGFFAHPLLSAESEHKASGNYGTLDQIAALKWVQKNIEKFGGDPGRVTIFGESAGSWSVNHLVASPLAKGLFQRAIGESGGAFGSMGTVFSKGEVENAGDAFAKTLLGETPPSLAALRAQSGEAIMAARTTGRRWSPNVDGYVFPDTVYNIFAAGKQNNVRVSTYHVSDEGATLGAGRDTPTAAEYVKTARTTYGKLADEFLKIYPAAAIDDQRMESRIKSYTDQSFGWEMRTWARMMGSVSSPAYWYFFSRVPPSPEGDHNGAFHAGEIIYVFDNLGKSPYPYANRGYTDVDRQLSNTMASYWVNFATTGNPNGKGLPEWPAYVREKDEALEFGDTVHVQAGIRKERLDFMDRYYAEQRARSN
jgi:para-nitrobenzyl esterase